MLKLLQSCSQLSSPFFRIPRARVQLVGVKVIGRKVVEGSLRPQQANFGSTWHRGQYIKDFAPDIVFAQDKNAAHGNLEKRGPAA